MEERKKVRIFTAFEKLNFSKIESWHQKYQENVKKLNELEDVEKKVVEAINKFEK